MHAPWERNSFETLEEACTYAIAEAKRRAAWAAEKSGAKDYELLSAQGRCVCLQPMIEGDIFVETRIEVTAVGRPEW